MHQQHHEHHQPQRTDEYVGHHEHQQQLASARHGHTGHNKHAGHDPEIFKRRFFICLLLTLPILYFASHFQMWFGYRAITFSGSEWVSPILSTFIYCYGGWVFLKGAWFELRSQIGMMTLIALAITVAFVYSVAVTLGLGGWQRF